MYFYLSSNIFNAFLFLLQNINPFFSTLVFSDFLYSFIFSYMSSEIFQLFLILLINITSILQAFAQFWVAKEVNGLKYFCLQDAKYENSFNDHLLLVFEGVKIILLSVALVQKGEFQEKVIDLLLNSSMEVIDLLPHSSKEVIIVPIIFLRDPQDIITFYFTVQSPPFIYF